MIFHGDTIQTHGSFTPARSAALAARDAARTRELDAMIRQGVGDYEPIPIHRELPLVDLVLFRRHTTREAEETARRRRKQALQPKRLGRPRIPDRFRPGDRVPGTKWTVIELAYRLSSHLSTYLAWMCRCDCGAVHEVSQHNLISGRSKGCRACGARNRGKR